MRPSDYGYVNWTQAHRDAAVARIQAQDEKRARERAAWDRLCGMASPIGRAVDL